MRRYLGAAAVLFATAWLACGAGRYWVSGVAAGWSSTANWSTSAGGGGGAAVPGSGDTAIFDGAGGNTGDCAIASAITIQGVQMGINYTGTVDAGTNDVVTTGDGVWSIYNGRFRSSSGLLQIAGSFIITTNGVLEKTGGTTVFSVIGNRYLYIYPGQTGRTQEFYNVLVTNNSYTLQVPNNPVMVNGDLTVATGCFDGGVWVKGNMLMGSPVINNPNMAGFMLCGTGLQTITHYSNVNSTVWVYALATTNTSAQGVRLNSPLNINGNNGYLTVYPGCKMDCNGKNLTTGSGWSIDSTATFTAPPVMTCNNGGIRTISPGGQTFNTISFISDEVNNYYFSLAGNMTARSNVTIVSGGMQGGSYSMAVGGDLTKLGARNVTIASFLLNGSGAQTITVTNAAGFNTPLVVTNTGVASLGTNLTVTAGYKTTIAPGGSLNLAGYDFTCTSGVTNSGTLMLYGNENATTPNNTPGSTVKYVAPTGSQAVKNWTYRKLALAGGGVTYTMPAANMSMTSLECTTPATIIVFNQGTTYAVSNLNFRATLAQPVRMQSASAGNRWLFNVSQPTPEVFNVNVSDSDASGGSTILATASTDSGNNINWRFTGAGVLMQVR